MPVMPVIPSCMTSISNIYFVIINNPPNDSFVITITSYHTITVDAMYFTASNPLDMVWCAAEFAFAAC